MERRARILIVEDEAITALAIQMELERAGYSICGRLSAGEDVESSLNRYPPDLILMDIRLAGSMDGVETAERVRERSEIPVIFMSGYDNENTHARAMALHPLGYLIKPIKISNLVHTIDAGLAQNTP